MGKIRFPLVGLFDLDDTLLPTGVKRFAQDSDLTVEVKRFFGALAEVFDFESGGLFLVTARRSFAPRDIFEDVILRREIFEHYYYGGSQKFYHLPAVRKRTAAFSQIPILIIDDEPRHWGLSVNHKDYFHQCSNMTFHLHRDNEVANPYTDNLYYLAPPKFDKELTTLGYKRYFARLFRLIIVKYIKQFHSVTLNSVPDEIEQLLEWIEHVAKTYYAKFSHDFCYIHRGDKYNFTYYLHNEIAKYQELLGNVKLRVEREQALRVAEQELDAQRELLYQQVMSDIVKPANSKSNAVGRKNNFLELITTLDRSGGLRRPSKNNLKNLMDAAARYGRLDWCVALYRYSSELVVSDVNFFIEAAKNNHWHICVHFLLEKGLANQLLVFMSHKHFAPYVEPTISALLAKLRVDRNAITASIVGTEDDVKSDSAFSITGDEKYAIATIVFRLRKKDNGHLLLEFCRCLPNKEWLPVMVTQYWDKIFASQLKAIVDVVKPSEQELLGLFDAAVATRSKDLITLFFDDLFQRQQALLIKRLLDANKTAVLISVFLERPTFASLKIDKKPICMYLVSSAHYANSASTRATLLGTLLDQNPDFLSNNLIAKITKMELRCREHFTKVIAIYLMDMKIMPLLRAHGDIMLPIINKTERPNLATVRDTVYRIERVLSKVAWTPRTWVGQDKLPVVYRNVKANLELLREILQSFDYELVPSEEIITMTNPPGGTYASLQSSECRLM